MPYLDFKGKEFVRNHHLSVPHRPLVPDTKKSVGKSRLDGNLIVHGDNLHALKSLIPMYAGRVNCIYIDPPYNTGNEGWCYNDNVNSPQQQAWLNQNPVGIEDGLRHDKWCAMMWPRLVLLHELLAEDGVIFISIDDNEQHHLRMMMDEIFGANNAVANIIWQKKFSPQNDARWFSDNHDFVLCYAKEKNLWRPTRLQRTEKQNQRYSNIDNDPRGVWASGGLDVKTYQKSYDYPITTPSGRIVHPPESKCWRYSSSRFNELVKDNRIWFGEKGNNVPRVKRFLSELKQGLTPLTVWLYEEVGHTQGATQQLRPIEIPEFTSPKPVALIQKILKISAGKNAIILDSFAGSGTTAHATLALNKEDGGNRKFILVECEDYADKITAERVRRVIKGVPKAKDKDLKAGLGGEFTYCELGEATDIEKLLSGQALPDFEALGTLLFHTATDEVIDVSKIDQKTGYLGESSRYHLWLIYEPDLKYLKSNEAALTLDKAQEIADAKGGDKRHLVFAPAVFVSRKVLDDMNIPVDYQPLPWGLYKVSPS